MSPILFKQWSSYLAQRLPLPPKRPVRGLMGLWQAHPAVQLPKTTVTIMIVSRIDWAAVRRYAALMPKLAK